VLKYNSVRRAARAWAPAGQSHRFDRFCFWVGVRTRSSRALVQGQAAPAWIQPGRTGGPQRPQGSFRSRAFPAGGDILWRTRETHSQIGLTSHQRRENLRGAFAVPCADKVNGREVLLVDDVYTTGTTVSERSRVLRRAGAVRVWVATVARTLESGIETGRVQYFKVSKKNRSCRK
jgi:Phosphoribosyl transferase domain